MPGAPDTNRTYDLSLRRGPLYPLSYRGARGHFNGLAAWLRRLGALLLAAATSVAQAAAQYIDDGETPYVPTPPEVVERMLRMGEVTAADTVYDLGSGDGRIVIAAAKRGARGVGIDIDRTLVARAQANAARAGVAARATFRVGDLFRTDLSPATVITLYLLPEVNLKLIPVLAALKPGTRIVSHDWDLGPWRPDETLELRTPEKLVGGRGGLTQVLLWVVPARVAGEWAVRIEGAGPLRLRLAQRHQALEAEARSGAYEVTVRGSRVRGTEVKFALGGRIDGRLMSVLLSGRVSGDTMQGTATIADGEDGKETAWRATRTQ